MTKRNQIYVCELCGNIVEMVEASDGTLVCCGQPMTLQVENTKEASLEKHIPVVAQQDGHLLVKIGSVAHPMESSHFIEWIDLIEDSGKTTRIYLKPGDAPEAVFCLPKGSFTVRAYCNLHGLWKA